MTEKRKQEILKLIDEDSEELYTMDKEEAKTFLASLSKEENKNVSDKLRENRRKREYKQQEKERQQTFNGYWNKVNGIEYAVAIVNNETDILNIDEKYDILADFVIKYLKPKKPNVKKIEDLNITLYKCPDCTIQIGQSQPFCSNCGLMIDWGSMFDWDSML